MIYLEERFDLDPAAPSTRDRFVDVVNEHLLPSNAQHGARLVGAWFAHENWYSQIVHVTEFDDLAALGSFREASARDGAAAEAATRLAALAPGRHVELLEPLGPIPPATLHAAIEASAEKPTSVHTFAILDVSPGRMADFATLLSAGAARLPIVACWRHLTGPSDRIVDLWNIDTGKPGYRPDDPGQEAFFGPLRQIAPKEKMMRLHVMPYSPLR